MGRQQNRDGFSGTKFWKIYLGQSTRIGSNLIQMSQIRSELNTVHFTSMAKKGQIWPFFGPEHPIKGPK